MAETIMLTGRLADFTSQAINPNTTIATVKAPAYAPGPGVEITTSAPSAVTVGVDGAVTLRVVQGVGWLHLDGLDWSEQIRFVAAEGMTTLWEAVLNAHPYPTGMKEYLGIKGDIQDMLDDAVAAAPSSLRWPKSEAPADLNTLDTPGGAGTYYLRDTTYANQPPAPESGGKAGTLEVLPTQSAVIQRVTYWANRRVWIRTKSSVGGWSAWEDLTDQTPDRREVTNRDANQTTSPGTYWIWSTPTYTNLPEGMSGANGILETLYTRTAVTQRVTQWWEHNVWMRSQNSNGSWSPWDKIAQKITDDTAMDSPTASGGLKRVPLALTTPLYAGTWGRVSGYFRMILEYSAPIIKWRLHISNTDLRSGVSRPFTLGGVAIGKRGTGPEFEGQRSTIKTGTTAFAAGEEWISDWRSDDLSTAHLVQMDYTAAEVPPMMGPCYYVNHDESDGETGYWIDSLGRHGLWVWIEAVTYEQTPTVAILGSSTSCGQGASFPLHGDSLSIVGRKQGFLPVHYAFSGDALTSFSDESAIRYTRWAHFAPYDSIIIQPGSNDINAGASLSTIQSRFNTVAGIARKMAGEVLSSTAHAREPELYPVVKAGWNDWLRSNPDPSFGVIDYDEMVSPQGVTPAEFRADESHLNNAGYALAASAFAFPICRPRVVSSWA